MKTPAESPSAGSALARVSAAIAAYLLYAILALTLVETWVMGSALRWLVTVVGLAYAACTYLVWKRIGHASKAWLSTLLLLLLLVLSAWRLGSAGSDGGLTVLRVPAATLATLVVVAAMVMATYLLSTVRFLSGLGRFGLLLFSLYCLLPFVIGLTRGQGFDTVLGDAMGVRWFPWWLRGTVLGAYILLPLGLLTAIARLVSVWRSRSWTDTRPYGLASVAIVLSILLTVPDGARYARSGLAADPAATTPVERCPPPSVNPTALTPPDDLDALAHTSGRLTRLAPGRDLSVLDPVALSQAIGGNPQAVARLVQQQIRLEPYAGALRGPAGTWLARAGNSVDRALLLATLLRRSGHRVRFARGILTEAQAASLIRSSLGESRSGRGELADQIIELTDAHVLFVVDSLYGSRDHRSTTGRAIWKRAVREAREHLWVQVQAGDRWIDIDPTPLAPGQAPVRPVEVIEQLPEAMLWRVRVEVEVERAGGQAQGLLSVTLPSAYLGGVPITLFHELDGDKARPVLTVGDVAVRGATFDHGLPADSVSSSPAFDPFGRARRDVSQPSPTPTSSGQTDRQMTAQWLTICVAGPGGERSARYSVFAGDVIEGLHTALGIGVITGQVPSLLPISLLATDERPSTLAAGARLLAAVPYAYAALRSAIKISTLDPPPLVYVDAPNVLVARARPVRGANGEAAGSVEDLDLTLKAYRILRSPESPSSAYAHLDLIYQGVLDHIVERAALADESRGRSVGALMEDAAIQGIPLRMVRRANDMAGLGVSPAGMAYARAALERGLLLLLPERRPSGWESHRLGWWEVLPHSGWTQDTDEEGRHSTTIEQPATTGTSKAKTAAARKAFVERFACGVLVLASFTAGLIALAPDIPGEAIDDVAREVSEKLNDILDEFYSVCEKVPKPKPPRVTNLPKFPRPQNWKLPPGPQKRRPYLPPGGRVGGRGPR